MANNNANANGRRSATIVTYRECHHNHSRHRGHHIVDVCNEFIKAGEDLTPEAFICAACRCPRNFHRREEVWVAVDPGIFHLLHLMAAAPAPPPLVPLLAAHVPQDVIVPQPPRAEENLGDGVVVEEAEVVQPRRRERADWARSEAIRAGATGNVGRGYVGSQRVMHWYLHA